MCGLIYGESFTDEPINGYIMGQFEKQKNRGRDGFGVYDKDCQRLVRATKERKIIGWLKNHPSKTLMFHHRLPTSTANVKNACHPFSTKEFFKTNYVLIHNGSVANSKELKVEHDKLGIEYHSIQKDGTFNDSEALLWDVALYLEGKQDELKAYGGIAFICMAIPKDGRKHTKLHFARNYSKPLMADITEEAIMLASEGGGEEVEVDKLYSYDYRTGNCAIKDMEVPTWVVSGGYNQTKTKYRATTPTTQSSGYTPNSYADNQSRYDDEQYWDDYFNTKDYFEYDNYDEWLAAHPSPVKTERKRTTDLKKVYMSNGSSLMMNETALINKTEFIHLPKDEDYSFEAVMEGKGDELVMYRGEKANTPINVKTLIADKADDYLELSDGKYLDAFTLIEYDVDYLQAQVLADEAGNKETDDEVLFELDLLAGAKIALFTSPYWTSEHSVDPSFTAPISETVKEQVARTATIGLFNKKTQQQSLIPYANQ